MVKIQEMNMGSSSGSEENSVRSSSTAVALESEISSDLEEVYHDSLISFQTAAPYCKAITKNNLLAAQREELRRVMDFLILNEHHARTLLIHHCWDIDKLLNTLVDKGKNKLFSEAGIFVVGSRNISSLVSSPTVTCNICMEDCSINEVTMMDCGHSFCNKCWTQHFTIKITEGQSRRIRCMAHGCDTICDEAIIRNLVRAKNLDLAERFDKFLLESYIEDNKRVKWCPSVPHCGNAIRVGADEYCEVECLCGLQFCFRCSMEVHSPCSCLMWKLWTQKCQDESKTISWISSNAMPCPKCHRAIARDGGCDLMRCICGQTFCWLCGEATGFAHTWYNIDGHKCAGKEKIAPHVMKDLSRYMHHYDHYMAQKRSYTLEVKLGEALQMKVLILERNASTRQDFSWAINGLRMLLLSRRFLAYSYPFAYYMFGDSLFKDEMTNAEKAQKQNQLEVQQRRLQGNVDILSNLIQEQFQWYSTEKLIFIRMNVIKFSELIDAQCKQMHQLIESDFLGSLKMEIHNIAPYNSNGVERAVELSLWDSVTTDSAPPLNITIGDSDSLKERADNELERRRVEVQNNQRQPPSAPAALGRKRISSKRLLKKLLKIPSSVSTCILGKEKK
ncbi:probable E3 ubiquitin-protein ligase ARI2 isoform X1 [Papaver somniferum]|uniref:probable E3 ubiquitin-protein ligase ARI2 isoform X1 n=2 Tax=Papaver somniferum TaxID=3469 RepID=UPI000E702C9F|nr:probable E3 ubiquitin-protein ligase ARI2 isoform X1 [Papaver somniferum]